jgi:hypothetical protein
MLPLLAGCLSSQPAGDCNSQYEPVANAPTLRELERELREDVDPRVRSLKVIDKHPDEGKVYINLLNRRNRTVMSLDMWRQDDGTWTAQQWSQCID